MRDDFVAVILTHGRADNVLTYDTLIKAGYTGKILLIIDNEDDTAHEYYSRFGKDNIYMFDKKSLVSDVDVMDSHYNDDRQTPLYARNACFDIVKNLGYKYFLMLDDDYYNIRSRVVVDGSLRSVYIKNFDDIVNVMLDFLETSNATAVAMAQTGDFIGGKNSNVFKNKLTRKAMNAFFCKSDRKFKWIARMNDDVTTYVTLGSRGDLFLTVANISVDQPETQAHKGGLTEPYLNYGTYVKSFYSVMSTPSSVKVYTMGAKYRRFHHIITWENAVPKIISGDYKK